MNAVQDMLMIMFHYCGDQSLVSESVHIALFLCTLEGIEMAVSQRRPTLFGLPILSFLIWLISAFSLGPCCQLHFSLLLSYFR